ncbi:hypothetical protein F4779DRAFT_554053 [Xylariaceae sp. FL0662B]|nr:hypothetical protein F4779DRAFT_554053 [Xylariaceae sp. FL0662B]
MASLPLPDSCFMRGRSPASLRESGRCLSISRPPQEDNAALNVLLQHLHDSHPATEALADIAVPDEKELKDSAVLEKAILLTQGDSDLEGGMILETLLRAGVDVNEPSSYDGRTTLHLAAFLGRRTRYTSCIGLRIPVPVGRSRISRRRRRSRLARKKGT